MVEEEELRLQAVTQEHMLAGRQTDALGTRGALRSVTTLLERLRSSVTTYRTDEEEG